jgi:hypothetical protein
MHMKNKITRLSITILFILLFLYTGISKILNYEQYASEIQQSPLLKIIPIWAVWIIPVIELIVAIMLLTREWRLKGFYICCLLMVLFTFYVIGVNQFSYYIPCSCGGLIDSLPGNIHILLNGLLVVLAMLGIYLEKNVRKSIRSYKNITQTMPGLPHQAMKGI